MSAQLRPSVGSAHTRIMGLGGHLPERVVTNEEICRTIDSSDEWIRSRTGIVERRWAGADETVVDLAERAAARALEQAGLTGAEIDAVIVATISHALQTPSCATLLADRLGATPAAAFDLSAACAGFPYGVAVASDMVRGGSATHVLVVGVEKLSEFTDPTDRGSAFIFADGAGAAVVGPSDEPGIGPVVWGSDGSQADLIRSAHPWTDVREDPEGNWPWLTMQGPAVFRWAVWQMAPVATKALAAAGVGIDDLDAFVPHQANVRIIDSMCKELHMPATVHVARDISHMGNTSAASIPLAMDRMLRDGQAPHGGLALMIGFGAGLTYAAQVVRLP